jgi:nicotinamidase-related amidase
MQEGAASTDIVGPLQPYADRADAVIEKNGYTFFNDKGMALVRDRGWTDLYLCGIATESCVLKTAVDAFERDLTPWLIRDASASHAGQAAHEAGLLVAGRFIGKGQLIGVADVRATLDAVRT